MTVSRKPAAAPVKKTATRSGRASSSETRTDIVGTMPDRVYVRHQALSFARSLFPSPEPNEKALSASQLITAASKLESYMLNGRGASTEEDD